MAQFKVNFWVAQLIDLEGQYSTAGGIVTNDVRARLIQCALTEPRNLSSDPDKVIDSFKLEVERQFLKNRTRKFHERELLRRLDHCLQPPSPNSQRSYDIRVGRIPTPRFQEPPAPPPQTAISSIFPAVKVNTHNRETSKTSGLRSCPPEPLYPYEPPGARCPETLRLSFSKLPFRSQYEILRNLECFGGRLAWASIPKEQMRLWVEAPIEQVVRGLYGICKAKGVEMEIGEILPMPESNYDVPVYRLRVDHTHQELKLQLLPVIMQSGYRSVRKFGPDRHLQVYFVEKEDRYLLKDMKKRTRLVRLGERVFEFLYSKEWLQGRYFATEGEGLESFAVRAWIDWHIPVGLNKAMKWAKFVARLDLAFSKTTESIQIGRHERIHDLWYPAGDEAGKCLTDGCGLISEAALLKICRKLDLRKPWPSALQGRIGSAKGVWLKDPASIGSEEEYIRSRDSQIKYDLPQAHADPMFHSTFEVLKPANAMEGHLNSQMITVLDHNGVGSEVFVELYKQTVQKWWDDLFSDDTHALMKLLDHACKCRGMMGRDRFDRGEGEGDAEVEGSRELNSLERARKMLGAGFKPSENAYLTKLLDLCFRMLSKKSTERFNLRLPKSARVLMVPDPTGTLEPGEVYLNLTTIDSEKIPIGRPEGDVVVGRNPALRPSDMQRVRCIDRPELRSYRDVIVMSVKGEQSLASLLGGGDYDGDDVLVIWDPEIVNPFRNYPFEEVDVEHCFEKDNRSLGDVLNLHQQHGGEQNAAYSASKELFNRFVNGSFQSELGSMTRTHEEAADYLGLSDPYVLQLAALCEHLLDASKSGNKFLPSQVVIKSTPCPDWLVSHKASINPDKRIVDSHRALGILHRASGAWVKEKHADSRRLVARVQSHFGTGDPDIECQFERWVKAVGSAVRGDRLLHEASVEMTDIKDEFRKAMGEAKRDGNGKISAARKASIYRRVLARFEEVNVGTGDTVDLGDFADKCRASLALHISPGAIKEATSKLLRVDSGFSESSRGKEDSKSTETDVWWWPWEHPRLFAILCNVKATEMARKKYGSMWWEMVDPVLAKQ